MISNIQVDPDTFHMVNSPITTGWRVKWDEQAVARDLFQNFFDANERHLSKVIVTSFDHTVVVTAPTEFDLNHLFYLGSEKNVETNVGKYGEGAKAAILCLLRDFGATFECASGSRHLQVTIGDETIGEMASLRPLRYRFAKLTEPIDGTQMVIGNCSKELSKALGIGLDHFFHESNPCVGKLILNKHGFAIYCANNGHSGGVFYRKIKRSHLKSPIIIRVDESIPAIEEQVSSDRDRRAFGPEMRRILFAFVHEHLFGTHKPPFHMGQHITSEELLQLLLATKKNWAHCDFLAAVPANPMNRVNLLPDQIKSIGADQYFADEEQFLQDPHAREKVDELRRAWIAKGLKLLPAHFANLSFRSLRNAALESVAKERSKLVANQRTVISRSERRILTQLLNDSIDWTSQYFFDLSIVIPIVKIVPAETYQQLRSAAKKSGVCPTELLSVFPSDAFDRFTYREAVAECIRILVANHSEIPIDHEWVLAGVTGIVFNIFIFDTTIEERARIWDSFRKTKGKRAHIEKGYTIFSGDPAYDDDGGFEDDDSGDDE